MKYTPQSEAEETLLRTIRNDDFRAWEAHMDGLGLREAVTSNKDLAAAVYEAVLLRVLGNLAFDAGEGAALDAVRLRCGLTEEEASAVRHRRGPKALRALAKHLLTDGILTPSERAELDALGAEMSLSKEEVADIVSAVESHPDA